MHGFELTFSFVLILQCSSRHVGHFGREIEKSFKGEDIIESPWNISCSVQICEGPMAEIYCSGLLIETTWRFGLHNSCPGPLQTFEPAQVLANFKKLTYPIKKEDFVKFCDENFNKTQFLELASLPDFIEEAPFLKKIKDLRLRNFALQVHRRWSTLARRFVPKLRKLSSRIPVLPVPNPFIVPGGFFQVYFYWDSYWILKGLFVSNMTQTARGMLSNFAFIINKHGFIPNSGNIQLSRRSQPPLFTQMVFDYWNATHDNSFLLEFLPIVDKEIDFWIKNRTIEFTDSKGIGRILFHYKAITNCPRPENFLVDVENGINGAYDPLDIWSSTASACESGWDFSSRWFDYTGKHAYTKYSIKTNALLPVDLNSFMAWNFKTLASLYKTVNNTERHGFYARQYEKLSHDLDVFWNDKIGVWQDIDLSDNSFRNSFYPSNVYPLLAIDITAQKLEKLRNYIRNSGVLEYPGGIPSALKASSTQQWDFPNVWAPNVHLFVECLLRTRDEWLISGASKAAKRFVTTVMSGLLYPKVNTTATIWEKYDARYSDGTRGEGGEYTVQEGFGWTNGAVLYFIKTLFIEETFEIPSVDSSLRSSTSAILRNIITALPIYIELIIFIPGAIVLFCLFRVIISATFRRNRHITNNFNEAHSESSERLLDGTD